VKPENHKQITDFLARKCAEFTSYVYDGMTTYDKLMAVLAVDHMHQVLLGDRLTYLARQLRREDLWELLEELWHKEK